VTIGQLSAEEARAPIPENQGWIVSARIAMARAAGVRFGRKPKLNAFQRTEAIRAEMPASRRA
jgi:hypothetical protein